MLMSTVIGAGWILYYLLKNLFVIKILNLTDKMFLLFSTYFAVAYFGCKNEL